MGSAVSLQDIPLSLKRNVNKSKRQALLNRPITSDIDYWVSDTVRKIWEPRIIRIAKAWKEIEILSVSDGLRDCCRMDGMYNHELLSLADKHPELIIFLDRDSRFTRRVYLSTLAGSFYDIKFL